jgi:hypothetical protein
MVEARRALFELQIVRPVARHALLVFVDQSLPISHFAQSQLTRHIFLLDCIGD